MADSSTTVAPAKATSSADFTPFDQVAGHSTGPLTRFYAKNGKIYKPSQAGSRGDREAQFYEHTLKEIPDFTKFAPKFFGIELIEFPSEVHQDPHKFIVMEDLTNNYNTSTLCVADIKLGVVTYDIHASEKKRNYEIEKASSTTTVTLGFRVCGLKVFEDGKGLKKYDKDFGKNLNERTVQEGIENFFPNPKLRSIVVPLFTHKLYELLDWFENNTTYSFVGTSILFLYDGKLELGATEKQVEIKVIDFAHIDKTGKRDEGYIFGLKNLIKVFETIEATDRAKAVLV